MRFSSWPRFVVCGVALLLGSRLLTFSYSRLAARLTHWQQLRRAAVATRTLAPTLREGDLLFQTSPSAQSVAIQLATHSPYSHCGLLLRQHGTWQVLEAVQPVRLTPLARWVARGQGGHFVVKRLRDADQVLTPAGGPCWAGPTTWPSVGRTSACTARSCFGKSTTGACTGSWAPCSAWAISTCGTPPCKPSCANATARARHSMSR